jgi:hypothetical protein
MCTFVRYAQLRKGRGSRNHVVTVADAGSDDEERHGVASAEVAFASGSVARRGGLRLAHEVELESTDFVTTIADICVAGLPGWVAVVTAAGREPLRMRLWAPRGVEVHVRPPIPCPTPLSIEQVDEF